MTEKVVIRSFRDLAVWQRSMDLAVAVYRVARMFPRDEQYRLTAQLTRAAASIPANIAEGHARATRKDYAHFVSIAQGSTAETETFLQLAHRLGYLTDAQPAGVLESVRDVSRMLMSLHGRLRAAPRPAVNGNPR